ncbi:CD151 antigen [Eurytemora carolleeae]|uniref:CD151 antigen n=1 Tax=Eurytemora carolleeae TaxID=1294199 RepID=UPI000C77CC5E|nr:CD151 antigen [Eurytemora carolleeae]|eukprot:XP_023323278.1 CD151 antigen-like [Eurytemora affinis]
MSRKENLSSLSDSINTVNRYGRTNSYGKAVKHSSLAKLRPDQGVYRTPEVKALRAFVGVYNMLFWITGAAVFSLGVSCLLDIQTEELSTLLQVELVPYQPGVPVLYWLYLGLLLAGSIIFITGFMGCWSSMQGNSTAAMLYIMLLLISCIGEISLTAIAIISRDLILERTEQELVPKLKMNYNIPGHDGFSRSIDLMQTKFECCGLGGLNDYTLSTWSREGIPSLEGIPSRDNILSRNEKEGWKARLKVPLTCCALTNSHELTGYLDPKPSDLSKCQDLSSRTILARYTDGCLDKLLSWGEGQCIMIAGVAVGGAVLHILGIVLTCCLLQKLHPSQ